MQRRLSGSTLIVAIPLLLGLVALASRPASPGPTVTLAAPAWIGVASDTILQTLLILLVVAALVTTGLNIWALFPLPSGRPPRRPLRASFAAYLYFAAAICVLIVLRERFSRSRAAPPQSAGGGVGLGTAGATPISHGIIWLSLLIALVIIGGAGVLFVRWWRSAGGPGASGDRALASAAESRDRVVSAIGESLDAVRAEPDPRRAVIAAYAHLEAELRAVGRPRNPSEAPLEYVARILTAFEVGAVSLRRLTDLFEWAKFSQHPVDASMKKEAIAALERVRADLSDVPVRIAG